MRFVTFHGKESGRPIYVAADRVEAIAVTEDGSTEVCASCSVGLVAETPDEVLRMVAEATADVAACAAVVDAARRLIAWLDDPNATYGAHEAIVHDLRSALAAMEVPRG